MGYKNLTKERIGQKRKNNFGSVMEIVEYNKAIDIWVKFEQGNLVNITWQEFSNGYVKNVYDKTVHGVGYIGEGFYKPYKNGKPTSQYATWEQMLRRCYNPNLHEKFPTYMGCSVAPEWHNFQNFAKWFDDNFYKIDGEKMELDKDILIKGNKVYSPETCVFTPNRINALFINRSLARGSLPLGVIMVKRTGKYQAQCNNKNERFRSRTFSTPDEAFQAYKTHKEKLIKQIANNYKNKIPARLYDAMFSYEVDIND